VPIDGDRDAGQQMEEGSLGAMIEPELSKAGVRCRWARAGSVCGMA
jgi:hypothetical protein